MGYWVTKLQPATDQSLPLPMSTAFVRYIHESHANTEWWPVHCKEIDVNFLHAAYTEHAIVDRWTAAARGGHAGARWPAAPPA